MLSVSGRRQRSLLALTLALVAAGALAGCSTTQEKAARYQLNDARTSFSASHGTKVVVAGGPVRALRTTVTSSKHRSALIVYVINTSSRTRGDLPISVGYTVAGHRVFLNAKAGGAYFDSHLPPIAAHHSIAWVFIAEHRLPHGARAFARVGARPSVKTEYTQTVGIRTGGSFAGKSLIRVKMTNLGDIPQYQLPVYVHVRGPDGERSAGTASVIELDPGASMTVKVKLIGRAAKGRIFVAAIPTILK